MIKHQMLRAPHHADNGTTVRHIKPAGARYCTGRSKTGCQIGCAKQPYTGAYPTNSVPCSSARNSPTGRDSAPKCSAMMVLQSSSRGHHCQHDSCKLDTSLHGFRKNPRFAGMQGPHNYALCITQHKAPQSCRVGAVEDTFSTFPHRARGKPFLQ